MTGDPNWANVFLLAGFDSGTAIDEGPSTRTLTLGTSTTVSTTEKKFGTHGLSLPEDNYLRTDAVAATLSGATPWTIEGWFYWNTAPSGEDFLLAQADASTTATWALLVSGTNPNAVIMMYMNSGSGTFFDYTPFSSIVTISGSTWYHIAADFDGTTLRMYLDGVNVYSDSTAFTLNTATVPVTVGAEYDSFGGGTGYGFFDGYADEVRITSGVARYATDTSFTPPAAAFERGPENDLDDEIIEGIGLFGGAGLGDVFNDTLTDGIGITHATLFATWSKRVSEALGLIDTPQDVKRQPAIVAETIGVNDVTAAIRGVVLTERLAMAANLLPNHYFQLTAAEIIELEDELKVGLPQVVTEDIGLQAVQQVAVSLTVLEALGLAEALGPAMIYGKTVSEVVGVADAIGRFFGAALAETIGVTPALVGSALRPVAVSEGLGLAETVTPRMVLRVIAEETLELEAEQALRMIFSPTLSEGIELAVGYVAPNGSITTWAMNTRTGAVTEYDNYAFNSFARMGDKYIGATEDGLYELLGDDDDGTDIVAQIKSGFAQWAGSRFTMFKAAYLGVRGGGDFILKLTTGDGKTYNYGVSARDMRTTKINVGKGLRARYFAFELISSGQDFDLDAVEFVPLIAERRV